MAQNKQILQDGFIEELEERPAPARDEERRRYDYIMQRGGQIILAKEGS